MIEGGNLFQFTGTLPTQFAFTLWRPPPSITGSTYTWTVPVSQLTSPATTQKVVFQGDGGAPFTATT